MPNDGIPSQLARVVAQRSQRLLPSGRDIGGTGVVAGKLRRDLLHRAEPVARLGVEALHDIIGLWTAALRQPAPPVDRVLPTRHRRRAHGGCGRATVLHAARAHVVSPGLPVLSRQGLEITWSGSARRHASS
jgi:hypothetical protein